MPIVNFSPATIPCFGMAVPFLRFVAVHRLIGRIYQTRNLGRGLNKGAYGRAMRDL